MCAYVIALTLVNFTVCLWAFRNSERIWTDLESRILGLTQFWCDTENTHANTVLFFCEDQSLKNTFLWPYHPFFHPSWKNGFLDQTSTVKSWGRNTYSAPVSLSLNYSLFFHIQWRFVKLLHCDWIWQQYQRELKKKNPNKQGDTKKRTTSAVTKFEFLLFKVMSFVTKWHKG